jgi:hypothetical protein
MRNSNAFSFRPTVETLADRTMLSVTPLIGERVIAPTDTPVKTSYATEDVTASWTMKSTAPVQGRKSGEGQKDW